MPIATGQQILAADVNTALDARVAKSLFDANTILKADDDNTPIALAVAASRIIARLAAGGIVAATPAEIKTLLGLLTTRTIFLPANEGYVNAGTPIALWYGGVVQGAANSIEPIVFFYFKVPDDFVSFTSLQAVWQCGAAAGNMYWRLCAQWSASTEHYDTHYHEPAIGVTATGGADHINVQTPATALSMATLALGDYIGIRFYRLGNNALDTLDAVVNLFGLLFTYVSSQ